MYHGDSVWQLLFVIGIVFTNAKKILFQSCAGKTYKVGATGIPSFSFQTQNSILVGSLMPRPLGLHIFRGAGKLKYPQRKSVAL